MVVLGGCIAYVFEQGAPKSRVKRIPKGLPNASTKEAVFVNRDSS